MNNNRLNNKIFIIVLILLSIFILLKLSRNSNEYNFVDNRMSYRFNMPTIKNILNAEFQDHFEETIADQMPKYNYFKLIYLKIANYVNTSTTYLLKLDKLNRYIKLGGVYLYKGYLLYETTTNEDFEKVSQDDVEEINNIAKNTSANIYLYFVETDSNYNFETKYKVESVKYLKEHLNIAEDHISSFNISSFDDYKDYFYKTDHHWNYRGSYKGYQEIATLMHLENILEPQEEICFKGIPSYGSKSKSIAGIRIFKDTMCMYQYDFPEFEIYSSNKKITNYGSTVEELNNAEEISYGGIYGGDDKELHFINNGDNNHKKLLIYGNSYTNAINKLLAANYQETYIIDGRYYDEKSMQEYINEKDIDDVLILGNCMLFWDSINW